MTTPYTLGGKTKEHFPELHSFTLAQLGEQTVLVNRWRDGSVEVFGTTWCFTEARDPPSKCAYSRKDRWREQTAGRGDFRASAWPSKMFLEFGVELAEKWSLPMVARKGEAFIRPPGSSPASIATLSRLRAAHLEDQLARFAGRLRTLRGASPSVA